MKLFSKVFVGILTAAALQCVSAAWAVGEIGIGGAAGAAIPIGSADVRHGGSVGPALGAHISYEATENLSAEFSYDNLYLGHGMRIEPLIFSGVYHKKTASGLEPFLQLGAGAGRNVDEKNYNHLALKAGVGLIYKLGESLSLGPQVIYHYVDRTGNRSAYTITPGVFASYHFRFIQTQA